jgi:hypothetical protein
LRCACLRVRDLFLPLGHVLLGMSPDGLLCLMGVATGEARVLLVEFGEAPGGATKTGLLVADGPEAGGLGAAAEELGDDEGAG